MKILLTALNARYIHSNPAVHSLKAYACPDDTDTEVAEYTVNMNHETVLSSLIASNADIIAFSCYIWNIAYVRRLISDIYRIKPETEIWLGGPEVSYNPEQIIAGCPSVRGIMTGEGEITFSYLYRHWHSGKPELKDIPGIVYSENGKTVNTGSPVIPDIDSIPFWQKNISCFRDRIIYYESSRGCPYSCTYCLSAGHHEVRFRNTQTVLNELSFFLNMNVPQVKFIDRTFNCSRKRSTAILEFIRNNDNGITNFHFETAADILSEEEISALAEMRPGQVQLEIGVQSSNEAVLSAVNRHSDLVRLRKNVARIMESGNIHVHLDLIAGLPGEDISSFRNSFSFVYAMHPHRLQLGFLKILKGAPIEYMTEQYGIVHSDNPPYEVLSTDNMSYSDLTELRHVESMLDMFYNSRQFTYTISALEQLFADPYTLYLELYRYLLKHEYEYSSPSRMKRCELLYGFASETDPGNTPRYAELLTFDAYLRENCRKRPSFAPAPDAYRQCTFSGKAGNSHIEAFRYPVWNPGNVLAAPETDPVFIEFRYSLKNPVDGNFMFSLTHPD